jgi:hypothetical protein
MSKKKPIKLAVGGKIGSQFSSATTEEESSPYWKKSGYAKWSNDPNSSTVPNDPANQINRAKGEPNKVAPSVSFSNSSQGPIRTVTDGSNSTKYSAESDPVLSHLGHSVPSIGNLGNTEKQHYAPCINPRCKSFGKSHPNCLCYAGPGGSSLEGHFAKGGMICSGPHKEDCEHFADGGQVQEQQKFLDNPQDAIDHVGVQHGLLHLLTKLGHNGRSENQHKYLEDYADQSKRGHKSLDHHMSKLLGDEKLEIEPDKEGREQLKSHLQDLEQNPEKLMSVGGSLGSTLPMHAAMLGSRAANAVNYLNSIKPKGSQSLPLDQVKAPQTLADNHYNRAIDIAQKPHMVLNHVKNGTVLPSDLLTLSKLYPSLSQSMISKAGEKLIEAKDQGKYIPYDQKRGLSKLLGQPLDSTMSPMAAQAIMQANAPTQAPQSQGKLKKASKTELDQIDKTSKQLATPSQERLMGKD